ncbi:protein kinase-like domain, concanavalin A-like lectin/glucanase domain protein [Tanacetum coccineum]
MRDQHNDDAEITFMGATSFDQDIEEDASDMEAMPDDEILSVSRDGNEEDDSDMELSMVDEVVADNILDEIITKVNKEDTHINVSTATPIVVSFVSVPQSALVSSPRDALGAMKRFKEIQTTEAPGKNTSIGARAVGFRHGKQANEGSIMVEGDIDNLTIEKYMALTRGNQAPGVVKPEIGGNEDTFFGNKNDVAHEHVERVLNIISLFNILGVTHATVMLHIFPIILIGAAKRWVDRLSPGTVESWDLLKKAFIQRYCPPSKTAKQLEEIRNFKQEGDETLCQAWERYNDMLYKCPTHGIDSHQKTMVDYSQKWHNSSSSRNIDNNSNSEGIAAIVSKLNSLGRDMKKLKEKLLAISVGCQTCGGPHLDKECLLNEEVKYIEEVKYGEFGRPFPNSCRNDNRFNRGIAGYDLHDLPSSERGDGVAGFKRRRRDLSSDDVMDLTTASGRS